MTQQDFEETSLAVRGVLMSIVRRFNRASGHIADEEDVVQEALMTLWDLSQKGYPIYDAKALVIKITKTICIARYRKKQYKVFPLLGDDYVGSDSSEDLVQEEEINLIKEQLLACLTPTQRYYTGLRNDYSLSLDEIASLTKKPKGSIKVTLSQARKRMLDKLKKIQDNEQ